MKEAVEQEVVMMEATAAAAAEEEVVLEVEVVEVVGVVGHEAVVGEDGRSEGRPKRRRNM